MRNIFSLSFDDARAMADACLAAASHRQVAVSIAIADSSGTLIHFCRMDGARLHTVDLASAKARISAQVGIATAMIEQSYRQRSTMPPPGFPGAGGIPVMHLGACAGALGISGASSEIDLEIAQAGLAALMATSDAT
jgi:uncharacterized protein GlcG (DUF336 family)